MSVSCFEDLIFLAASCKTRQVNVCYTLDVPACLKGHLSGSLGKSLQPNLSKQKGKRL
jgi:hypothetical protein